MSDDGRRKLREYGIAPPQAASSRRALFGEQQVACPQCGSEDTEVLSEFGSTSCKALWRCKSCREPFNRVTRSSLQAKQSIPPKKEWIVRGSSLTRRRTDVLSSAFPSPCRQRPAPRIIGRGVADLCDSAGAGRRLQFCARPISDLAHDHGRRGSPPLLFDLLRPR